ncbi:MAG: DNA-processing protein DprA [Actinomycetota bacterium]
MNRRIIDRNTDEYPRLLVEIPDPPKRLYVAGMPLDQAPFMAVVGARRSTSYGREVAEWIASDLARSGMVVVSGMATGIDAAAHAGALSMGGTTVAVLGCGLDICYPPRNASLYQQIANEGTLVSEYGPGTRPMPYHFPARNRIIAGMCLGIVVVEGRTNGGAMITARLAMEFGREVFAVPGPVQSPLSCGPHSLIRDGATMVTSAADILEDVGFLQLNSQVEGPSLNADETRTMKAVATEPLLLDQVASRLEMPIPSALAVLSRLELKGLVVHHSDGRFGRALAGENTLV